jgi:hypothetical protein
MLKFHTVTRRQSPEARLQKAILQHLKLTAPKDVFWFHPANEGRRGVVTGANLKALGMLPGVADLVIVVAGRAFFMEIKSASGRLSDAQQAFAETCKRGGSEWVCVNNIDDALKHLRKWGAIGGRVV